MKLERVCAAVLAAAMVAVPVSAAPIDGTFSYQGRLTSGGAPVTGTADVRFSLWDDPVGGAQVGATVDVLGASVSDGLFNADLDFGVDALNGDERWLQIEVRSPAGSGGYVNLGRQAVLGAPYAIQTRGIFVDDALNIGVGTTTPGARLHVGGSEPTLFVKDDASNVGTTILGPAPGEAYPTPFQITTQSGGDVATRIIQDDEIAQLQFLDTATGVRDATFGSGGVNRGGFVGLAAESSFLDTVTLLADDDLTPGNGTANGLLSVRSVGGGVGGRVSVSNDDGNETIELLGGGSGGAGSVALFDSGGSAVARLRNDISGGTLSLFDSSTSFGFAAIGPDLSIDGGGYLSIARNNSGTPGFVVDGNFNGSQSTVVHIDGDYSMSFYTNVEGDPSVNLPTDAIASDEVLDEPGVAGATDDPSFGVALSTGTNVLLGRTISCPGSGYCVVIGTCQPIVNHTNGSASFAQFGVSASNSSLPSNQDVSILLPAELPTSGYNLPVTVHGMFSVSAGSNSFYLLATGMLPGNSIDVYDMQLSIMYFPTAYGVVTPTLFRTGGGDDDQTARLVPSMSPAEIRAERIESIAFEQNRRAAESERYAQKLAELESRIRELEARRGIEQAPARRAESPPDMNENSLGVAPIQKSIRSN